MDIPVKDERTCGHERCDSSRESGHFRHRASDVQAQQSLFFYSLDIQNEIKGGLPIVGFAETLFKRSDEARNREREREVDDGNAGPNFKRAVGLSNDELPGAREFFKADYRNEGRILQHGNEFIAERRNDALKGLRQHDVAHGLSVGHAERKTGAELPLRDGLNAAAEDFGNVCAGVKRTGGNGCDKRVNAVADDIGQRKVDDEDLNEERRAADAVDVDLGGKTQERGLGKLSKARNETDQEAQAHGKGRNFKRQTRASQKERNAVDD